MVYDSNHIQTTSRPINAHKSAPQQTIKSDKISKNNNDTKKKKDQKHETSPFKNRTKRRQKNRSISIKSTDTNRLKHASFG